MSERLLCRLLLCLGITGTLLLAYPIFIGKMYIHTDLGSYHLPMRMFYADCLRSGDSFAWIPSVHCGYFLHGEGQVGMYHPLHLLMYRWLPMDIALNIEVVWPFPFMILGAYLFARRWRLPRSASLFAAVTFAFSGFNLLHVFHVNMVQVWAHVPWLLLCIDIVMVSPKPRARALAWAGLALATGSQLLLGFPQSVYLSALCEGAYTLFLTWRGWWRNRQTDRPGAKRPVIRRAGLLFLAKTLGALIGCVQLLPTLDFLSYCQRAQTSAYFRTSYSLHPANLLQLAGPYFFASGVGYNPAGRMTHEAGLYDGVVVSVLVAWAIVRWGGAGRARAAGRASRPFRSHRALTWASLAFALAALILALGRYGGVYPAFSALPLVRAFRCPARHVALVQLGMTIAAAAAFADLCRIPRSPSSTSSPPRGFMLLAWLLTVGLVTLAAAVLLRIAGPQALPGLAPPGMRLLVSPLLFAAAATLVVCAAMGRRWALPALVLLSVSDQYVYGVTPFWQVPAVKLDRFIAESPALKLGFGERYYAYRNNFTMFCGAQNCGGYTGAAWRRQLIYSPQHTDVLRLASVRYVDPARPRPASRRKPKWEEIPDPLPRLRMVTHNRASKYPALDLRTTDITTTALVEEKLPVSGGMPGTISQVVEKPGLYNMHTEADCRQLVILAESYHAGWKAQVDGVPTPIVRVYGDFMGCLVEKGVHEVTFRFNPESLRMGKALSLTGLILTAVWSLCLARKPRRRMSRVYRET